MPKVIRCMTKTLQLRSATDLASCWTPDDLQTGVQTVVQQVADLSLPSSKLLTARLRAVRLARGQPAEPIATRSVGEFLQNNGMTDPNVFSYTAKTLQLERNVWLNMFQTVGISPAPGQANLVSITVHVQCGGTTACASRNCTGISPKARLDLAAARIKRLEHPRGSPTAWSSVGPLLPGQGAAGCLAHQTCMDLLSYLCNHGNWQPSLCQTGLRP